jgi:hypothetical protein
MITAKYMRRLSPVLKIALFCPGFGQTLPHFTLFPALSRNFSTWKEGQRGKGACANCGTDYLPIILMLPPS